MAGACGLTPVRLPGIATAYPSGCITDLGCEYGTKQRLGKLLELGFSRFSIPEAKTDIDIIVATTKGAADELLLHADDPAGQPWHIGAMVRDITGCRGRLKTVSAACASGTVALIQAARQITAGNSEYVLVIGIDLLSRFVTAGFDVLQGLSKAPCKPFDRNRDGLSLGEGLGVMAVCSASLAARQNLPILAEITGWGVSCDATHITAPSRTGSGLIRVLEQATSERKITVGAINAHGTGTVYNDAMELAAFGTHWNTPPPMHSVKGAIGHCLGAAGVIEAAIAVRSLEAGCIPPTVGYQNGDAPAGTIISGTSPLPLQLPSILSCNSGFGGINAGIIFSRSP